MIIIDFCSKCKHQLVFATINDELEYYCGLKQDPDAFHHAYAKRQGFGNMINPLFKTPHNCPYRLELLYVHDRQTPNL